MNSAQTIWTFALVLAFVAAWSDLRTRRIPNWLTVAGVFLGIAVHTRISGWHGTATSLEGVGLGLVLLLPLVLMRALGAGDWKLMGALGAFLGPILLLYVLLGSVLVSGLMAIVEVMRTRRVKE